MFFNKNFSEAKVQPIVTVSSESRGFTVLVNFYDRTINPEITTSSIKCKVSNMSLACR